MKIDKAIEILTTLKEPESIIEQEKFHDAVKLGIEALKYVQNIRHYPENVFDNPLPGETEE